MKTLLDPNSSSLKVCGVTQMEDALALVELGVHGIGINFWPQSKRYLSPEEAVEILTAIEGQIVRVGVFVNADPAVPLHLLDNGLIDVAQFHGDETPEYCATFAEAGHTFIKAIGVKNKASLKNITDYRADAILLDTPAPGVYGGTGETFDWTHAQQFIQDHPGIPVLLAGGITPENASQAIAQVHPAALDVASGSEISPSVKDLNKVKKLLASLETEY
ncbi:MAG: phosphoribosylanthranilate isomerase [Akkermansiaceae bacterium]